MMVTKIRCLMVLFVLVIPAILGFGATAALCSPIAGDDAKEVVIAACQKLDRVKSYHLTFEATTSLPKQGKTVSMIIKAECDVKTKPMMFKNIVTITTDLDPNNERKFVEYIEESGDRFVVYSRINDRWIKEYVPKFGLLDKYNNYFKAIKSAALVSESADFAVYEIVIDGSYLRDNIRRSIGNAGVENPILPEVIFKDIGDITYTLTIDKTTSMISKIEIDFSDLFSKICNNTTEVMDMPAEQKIKLREFFNNAKFIMTAAISQINGIDEIEIPQAAINAPLKMANSIAQAKTIGVVNINRIKKESPAAKTRQDAIDRKGQELAGKLMEDAPSLTMEQFRQRQSEADQELNKFKKDLECEIDEIIKQAVAAVVKEKKLESVIYKNIDSNILPGDNIDITSDVIEKMR